MEQLCQLGEDIWDMTSGSGPLGQDSWDRTSRKGQLGQDSLNRSAQEAAWTGEPGKDRDDRTAKDMTVVLGEQWPMWPGQGSWNRRTARKGHLGQDKRVRIGRLGPDI